MTDKLKRLISYGKNPLLVNDVEGDSVKDACMDMINYTNHFLMIYNDIRKTNMLDEKLPSCQSDPRI